MKKNWILLMVLLLSVGLNVGFLAGKLGKGRADAGREAGIEQANGEGDDPGIALPPRVRRGIERAADDLGLAGEARETFLRRQESFFQDSRAGRDRLAAARAGLRLELTSAAPDRERAEHYVAELGAAQADLERAFVTNFFETRELLDPRQQQRFLRFMNRIRHVRQELLERSARRGEAFRARRERRESRRSP